MKKSFIDDALKDGTGVNKIFGDYLENAANSWVSKEANRNNDDVIRMAKNIRNIIQVSQHNLSLLDKYIVEGFQSQFPMLSKDKISPPPLSLDQDPEEETESQPESAQHDDQNNELSESPEVLGEVCPKDRESGPVNFNIQDVFGSMSSLDTDFSQTTEDRRETDMHDVK